MLLEISLGQNKWHCDLNVRRKLVRVATVVTIGVYVSVEQDGVFTCICT